MPSSRQLDWRSYGHASRGAHETGGARHVMSAAATIAPTSEVATRGSGARRPVSTSSIASGDLPLRSMR
jgi:hypothetical protein